MAKNYRPSEKKKTNRFADHDHWTESIKSTCQWFPFHAIMEYTGNIMQDDTHIMSSLLKTQIIFCLVCRPSRYGSIVPVSLLMEYERPK